MTAALEKFPGGHHRMAGPQSLGLHRSRDPAGEHLTYFLRAFAHDDAYFFCLDPGAGAVLQHPCQHRTEQNLTEGLGPPGLHPLPLAGGQDDRASLIHGPDPAFFHDGPAFQADRRSLGCIFRLLPFYYRKISALLQEGEGQIFPGGKRPFLSDQSKEGRI